MNLNSKKYRYTFKSKTWNDNQLACLFIMLNPSTADENLDDATTYKCRRIAEKNDFGSFRIVNLFAWRATKPIELKNAGDPIGPENDKTILEEIKKIKKNGGKIIVAWGDGEGFKKLENRAKEVLAILKKEKVQIWILGETNNRNPWHPRNIECQSPFELTKF